jgi:hypothetical protein
MENKEKSHKAKLPDEVFKVYELTSNKVSRKYHWEPYGGAVDLNTLTLDEADDLHASGFPYLRKKEVKEGKPAAAVVASEKK